MKTYKKTEIAAVLVKCHVQDMLDAFPNEDRVRDSNMRQFATAVAGLLHISDFQRRRITHMMRHYRDMRRRFTSAASPRTGLALLHLVMQHQVSGHLLLAGNTNQELLQFFFVQQPDFCF